MNDESAYELTRALRILSERLDTNNDRVDTSNGLQDEANNLMRTLIASVQGLAQEIADMRAERSR